MSIPMALFVGSMLGFAVYGAILFIIDKHW